MPSTAPSPVQSFTCVKIGWMRMETGAKSWHSLGVRAYRGALLQPPSKINPSTRQSEARGTDRNLAGAGVKSIFRFVRFRARQRGDQHDRQREQKPDL